MTAFLGKVGNTLALSASSEGFNPPLDKNPKLKQAKAVNSTGSLSERMIDGFGQGICNVFDAFIGNAATEKSKTRWFLINTDKCPYAIGVIGAAFFGTKRFLLGVIAGVAFRVLADEFTQPIQDRASYIVNKNLSHAHVASIMAITSFFVPKTVLILVAGSLVGTLIPFFDGAQKPIANGLDYIAYPAAALYFRIKGVPVPAAYQRPAPAPKGEVEGQ
jgi:hypothetical protein